jgi:hypothetical protein
MIGVITMVRLTGYVSIGGRREFLNWTVTNGGIVEGSGLSASEITVHTGEAATPTTAPTPEAPAPVAEGPKAYESMNKTELMVECNNAGLSTTGTKADLIARLKGEEATEEGEEVAEPATEGEGNGGEGESE